MARRKKSGGLGTALVVVLVAGYVVSQYPGTLGALAILFVAGFLWRRFRAPRTLAAQELTARLGSVPAMSGAQFEVFVADLFRAMGHPAQVMGRSGDQGVDVLLDYQGERVAVQCKNYKKRVGNKPVQEVFAGARHHKCSQAWVVAPMGYTKGAFELAASVGVSLFDEGALRKWIGQVDKAEAERERAA